MSVPCNARTKKGELCQANAQPEKGFCVFHDPARKEDGERARRNGGLTRSRPALVLPPETPDLPLNTAKDVANLMADTINRTRRGELDPRIASGIGYLGTTLLNALKSGEIEDRVATLEATLKASQRSSVAALPDLIEGNPSATRDTFTS